MTSATIADCSCALSLIEGFEIEALFADRGYDTNKILNYAEEHSIKAVILPKRNRKEQREYDKELY